MNSYSYYLLFLKYFDWFYYSEEQNCKLFLLVSKLLLLISMKQTSSETEREEKKLSSIANLPLLLEFSAWRKHSLLSDFLKWMFSWNTTSPLLIQILSGYRICHSSSEQPWSTKHGSLSEAVCARGLPGNIEWPWGMARRQNRAWNRQRLCDWPSELRIPHEHWPCSQMGKKKNEKKNYTENRPLLITEVLIWFWCSPVHRATHRIRRHQICFILVSAEVLQEPCERRQQDKACGDIS